MNERDKDITDIRKERDNLALLLQRLIHASREPQTLTVQKIINQANGYLKRSGLEGSILR
jgi:hypothetical protein